MSVALDKISSPRSDRFAEVEALLLRGAEDGVFPGAVAIIEQNGNSLFKKAVGVRAIKLARDDVERPMAEETVFDVAALTNIMITTTILMRLVEGQHLSLSDRLSRFIQGFSILGKSAVTVEHLLSHSSGLPQWIPFYEELLKVHAGSRMGILTSRSSRDFVINHINRSALKYPVGSKQVYSDVGFILLGNLIEILTGLSLDRAAFKFIFQPLGLKSSSYIDLSQIKRRGILPVTELIAPTEECPWRKRMLHGEVHDDNAWAMGGIAGHAGLFATAGDVTTFAREILRAYHGKSSFLRPETVRHFFTPPEFIERSGSALAGSALAGWALGWELPNKENDFLTSHLSAKAVGHCGFTGCSLWLEPEYGLSVVLMSNRVHPTRSNKKIRAFRVEFHNAVLEALSKR